MQLYCWDYVEPFLGVPGYRPQFLAAPDDIGEEDRARLRSLPAISRTVNQPPLLGLAREGGAASGCLLPQS